ncbi:MAG: HNH endonuclease [Methylophaga sp.]|nr:HNH endonuclease [Methylophaga sp.]
MKRFNSSTLTVSSERKDNILKRILGNIFIDPITNCWNWQGATSGDGRGGGYGRISISGATSAVHRVIFVHFFGYIPQNKQVDHTCCNRLCCNPDHLELVSHKENQKRRIKRR